MDVRIRYPGQTLATISYSGFSNTSLPVQISEHATSTLTRHESNFTEVIIELTVPSSFNLLRIFVECMQLWQRIQHFRNSNSSKNTR